MVDENLVNEVRARLAEAKRVMVLTGAGVSAESGIPTFRGMGGLWREFDVMQLATPEGFHSDPKLVWEFYNDRRLHMAECEPNPGHYAIATMEANIPDFLLVTQNIDGLHQEAGSQKVATMHGSIWHVHPEDEPDCWIPNRDVPLKELPLRDAEGKLLRPAVVWFGEMLPQKEVRKMDDFIVDPPDMLFVVGTSSAITWVQFLVLEAKRNGVYTVEVNPEETDLSSDVSVLLRGPSGEILPNILPTSWKKGSV